MPPFPISRYLVPATPPPLDDRFTTVTQTLTQGLPATIPIDNQITLVLQLPTGLGAAWRDADPAALVSASDWQTAAVGPPAKLARAALRLEVRNNNRTSAVVPVVAGNRALVSDGSTPGVSYEIAVLAWAVYAGSMLSPGDFGSTITFAWRRSDVAVQQFATPPVNFYILPRLSEQLQFASWLNLRPSKPLTLVQSIALRRGSIDDAAKLVLE